MPTTKPDKRLRRGFAQLGAGAAEVGNQIRGQPSFAGLSGADRLRNATTAAGGRTIDSIGGRGAFSDLIRSGGFVQTSADERQAQDLIRGLGVDGRIGEASDIFRNNAGVGALENLSFEDLQALESNPAYSQMLATAQGEFLQGNPFLDEALAASQRDQLRLFETEILPDITAQMGGGFGLGGSAAINAKRRAAEEVSRQLAEQETQARFQNFAQERGFQNDMINNLAALDLQRATTLGQFDLDRGQSLGALENQRAAGLLESSGQARQQELQQIAGLQQIGQFDRAQQQDLFDRIQTQHDAGINDELTRLGALSSVLGVGNAFGQTTTGGGDQPSTATNVIGGALTGAGTGAAIGSAIPGVGTAIGAIGGGIIGGAAALF